jgi:hypothetical protein
MAVFKESTAVTKYNKELTKLEVQFGTAFAEYASKANALSYSEEQAKNYDTKHCAGWLESEIELLDLQIPFAGNINLIINSKLDTPTFRNSSLYLEPNSSMLVDIQQQVPICKQAILDRGRAPRRSKKTKNGKK